MQPDYDVVHWQGFVNDEMDFRLYKSGKFFCLVLNYEITLVLYTNLNVK